MKTTQSLDAYLQLEPELLESRIGFLLWRYQLCRSRRTARSIVQHMEALCRHPDYDESSIPRCGYQRTLKRWRMLAGENNSVREDRLRYVS
ncbi:MAG: ATP dependent RNA helicase [Candidatus Thiodiazotropha sp. (ex Lucina aurantia)]|nr:ATP dependent RNA helicase [Candidatus Thiodiazotropha taylori]MBT3030424.1 ATP dependent RNA helicase [Candidatus Thiodiazotropha sp. (ex Lucina pensylvanica)]MBT3051470.1 ATP dependent RNA helicase [Candidatus Thiodiazotropha sp. (ex Codakia orbicularis)]MBV2102989.1 ATP dependent RNA helicase [Candidatus Thiodiazotropha sp. (ex Lucina aurantia)]MBT3054614.1 ATP dependent RNA helicase [Candidatus Thiodiazotropha sp. (ex Codakia orbicularis)]